MSKETTTTDERTDNRAGSTPDELRERFVNGELSREEFERRLEQFDPDELTVNRETDQSPSDRFWSEKPPTTMVFNTVMVSLLAIVVGMRTAGAGGAPVDEVLVGTGYIGLALIGNGYLRAIAAAARESRIWEYGLYLGTAFMSSLFVVPPESVVEYGVAGLALVVVPLLFFIAEEHIDRVVDS